MKFIVTAMLALCALAPAAQASDATTVAAYQDTVLHGPARLVERLRANKISDAKKTVQALYFTWEAISPDSSLYSPDFAQEICAGGMVYACRGIVLSKDELNELYTGFGFGDGTLPLGKVKELAQKVLDNSILE